MPLSCRVLTVVTPIERKNDYFKLKFTLIRIMLTGLSKTTVTDLVIVIDTFAVINDKDNNKVVVPINIITGIIFL